MDHHSFGNSGVKGGGGGKAGEDEGGGGFFKSVEGPPLLSHFYLTEDFQTQYYLLIFSMSNMISCNKRV